MQYYNIKIVMTFLISDIDKRLVTSFEKSIKEQKYSTIKKNQKIKIILNSF